MNRERSASASATKPAAIRTDADAATVLPAFVAEHYDRLLRLAWLVCRDGSDAGDAVQIGLEQAWRHQAALRDDTRLRPWLDRIVVRAAARIARRRRSLLARIFTPRSDVAWIEPADNRMADDADRLALGAALGRLSTDHRAVIALHLHAGYSVAETAEIVDAPIETVRSRLRVAKEHLRRDLAEVVR